MFHRSLSSLSDVSPGQSTETRDLISNLYPRTLSFRLRVEDIQLKNGEVVRTLASYLPEKAINNTVMVSFTDASYLESFYASYNISRLERFSNFIIVAVDLKAYEILKAKNYPVAYYQSTDLSNEKTEKESLYESKDWKAKMANKIKIIRQAVVLNFNVLLFDSDVFLFRDPLPSILSLHDYDLIAQQDTSVCAGFMYPLSPPHSQVLPSHAAVAHLPEPGAEDHASAPPERPAGHRRPSQHEHAALAKVDAAACRELLQRTRVLRRAPVLLGQGGVLPGHHAQQFYQGIRK